MPERPALHVQVRTLPALLEARPMACREQVQAAVETVLAELMFALAIPGTPQVELASLQPDPHAHERWLRVFVNDTECRYDDELFLRAVCGAAGVPLGAVEAAYIAAVADAELPDVLASLCSEIVEQTPSVLLGREQAAAFAELLPQPQDEDGVPLAWPVPVAWLHEALSFTVEQRVALRAGQAIANLLAGSFAQGHAARDAAERVLEALMPEQLAILIPRDYLRDLTLMGAQSGTDGLSLMRDGLFYELGAHYPAFRFEIDDTLPPLSVAFRINHLTTLPRIGLDTAEAVVNDAPEVIALRGVTGTRVLNPANANLLTAIDLGEVGPLQAVGYTSWDALGYLILCFADELRRHSAQLLHSGIVQRLLDELEGAFPELVKAARARHGVPQLTRVLRNLLAEGVSIRNLRQILEASLDYDYIVADSVHHIIFDDRLPAATQPDDAWLADADNLTAFVRTAMKRYLSHLYTKGESTLTVYLISPELEEQVAGAGLTAEQEQRILAAVREEAGGSRKGGRNAPAILTTIETRAPLRRLLRRELPHLPVLAYQELSPEMNIQPLSRISLD